MVILIVVAFLGAWFAFEHTGERGRIARCANNLRTLGQATESFANDHQGGLPEAVINIGRSYSWDMALMPYLDPNLGKAKSVYDRKRLLLAVQKYFVCPSDPIERPTPRSYAMAGRDMHYGWPPAPTDKTGVGVIWDRNTVSILNNDDLIASAAKDPDVLPLVKQSVLPDPARTILLTELIEPNNWLERPFETRIFDVGLQKRALIGYDPDFHFGEFNYLMNDGHVELLTAAQVREDGAAGHNFWNINAGD